MTAYGLPPADPGPRAAAGPGVERWLFGLAASYERWPQDRYTFALPTVGLPLYVGHEERRVVSSGLIAGDVGAARYFAEVDGLGLVVLAEVAPDHPGIMWDLSEGRFNGLSIGCCLDPLPGSDHEWVYLREVSLTNHPADPRARVISTGRLAFADWELLTGEPAPSGPPARMAQRGG